MSAQVTMIVDLLEQITLHLHKPLGALILLVCLLVFTSKLSSVNISNFPVA